MIPDGVFELGGIALAQGFEAHGADHLRMAVVATFAKIDIATLELEGWREVLQTACGSDWRNAIAGTSAGDATDDHGDHGECGEHTGTAFDQAMPSGFAFFLFVS